ncbi:PKD domain-containing protein [Methanosarcina barkeri]|nr:PKD domain-containing protein [Methanosarcina barkeri]
MNKLYSVLIFLVFFGLGIPCASAANITSFIPQTVEMDMGLSQNVEILKDKVSDGTLGFNAMFSVLDSEVVEINTGSVLPVANFSTNISEGHAPLVVQFNDSSKNATSVSWNFGDETATSNESNPVHVFADPGNYTVNLTASNVNGTNSKLTTINVTNPVDWKYSPQEPVCGDTINVNGSASPEEKLNVLVTFEKNVSVSEGEYEYSLQNVSVVNELGNLFTVEATGVNNLNVRAKKVIWLTKSANASGDTAIVSRSNIPTGIYQIRIDGDAKEEVSEVNLKITASQTIQADSNGNFSYSYNTTAFPPGDFEVKVGNITKVITLGSKGEPVLPVANFSTNVSEGYAPLVVQFTDLSANADTVSWDFENDGVTDTNESNPVHEFTTPGNYTVNLTASNANGTNSKLATITVTENPEPVLPVANFSTNVSEGYAPLVVQFTDLSANADTVSWDFENDGVTDTNESNPVREFTTPGNYTVNLTASNANGTNSKLATITVTENPEPVLPVANFSTNVSEGYAPLVVQFTDLSANADTVSWDFENDGVTDTNESNPVREFTTPGNYTVNLTASNANGTNSKLATITVTENPEPVLPVANFSTNVSEGYAPLVVQFNDSSKNATGWHWDFGDGANSTEKNPMHIYTVAGTYTVNLTASNEYGMNSTSVIINVFENMPFPGYTNPPKDIDHDGFYEDINGDGNVDFDDVVAYYTNMYWMKTNVPVALFDYNNNNIIDFDDVVILYKISKEG